MTLQREHAHGARRVNANVLVLCVRRQNKRENEAQLYVCFPPSCRRSEGGDGRLKAAAAAITGFVSV
jgi:hypothetical protein